MPVVLAAGLGLAGSALSASAASKAGKAQAAAADAATQVQRDAAVQARIDSYPWAVAGASALYQYMDALGLSRPVNPIMPDLNSGPFAVEPKATQAAPVSLPSSPQSPAWAYGGNGPPAEPGNYSGLQTSGNEPQFAPQTATQPAPAAAPQAPASTAMTPALGFQETPGYQFQVQQGERGVLNSLAALGMKNSGKALKSLETFRQGLANQEYGNYLNRLAGMAGMGQSQANQTNSLMANAATNVGNNIQQAGAARASGYVGSANAWGQGLNQVGNALGQMSYNSFPSAPNSLSFGRGLY